MNRIISLIIAIALCAAASLRAQTTAPSLLVTAVKAPTIVSTNSVNGSSTTTTFTATFTAKIQANAGPITIGLPSAPTPFVGATGFSIVKNGLVDATDNYKSIVSYTAPANISVVQNRFVLTKDTSIELPITIAFQATDAANNSYAVQLNRVDWSSAAGASSTRLGNSAWITSPLASKSGAAIPNSPPLPPEIFALTSYEELCMYLERIATDIELNLYSPAQIGPSVYRKIPLKGRGTIQHVAETLNAQALSVKLSSLTSYVSYWVSVRDTDGRFSLQGADSALPVNGKGGLTLPYGKLQLDLVGDAFILYPNLRNGKVTAFDLNGDVSGTQYLSFNEFGFWFRPTATGRVLLELTTNDGTPDGKTIVFDLRSGTVITGELAVVSAGYVYANTVEATDSDSIDLIPVTKNGVGINVRASIRNTVPRTLSIAAMTSEGYSAVSIKFRMVYPTKDAEWTVRETPKGVLFLTLPAGEFQAVGIFDRKHLSPKPFVPQDPKG